MESFSRPPPRGTSGLRRSRGVLGAPQEQPAAQRERAVLRLLPVRRASWCPRRTGPPSPSSPAAPQLSSCRHDPVRAFAPVLTAMPGQGIPLGDILDDSGYAHRDADAWALPLRGPPARSSSRTSTRTTAAPRAPTTAPSSPTGACYCPAHRARCWNSGRSPAPPPPEQAADRDTQDRRSSPATSSAASPPTTPTATTASQCPAAMGKIRCPLRPASMTLDRDPARDPHPAGAPPGLLHPADHHRPARGERQDRAETRLPVSRHGAGPTPAAPAPSAASPPPRTPPPTTSAAAGAASSLERRSGSRQAASW